MLRITPPTRHVTNAYEQRLALNRIDFTNPHKDNYQFLFYVENPWRDGTPLHTVTCTPLQKNGKPLPSHQRELAIEMLEGGAMATAKFTLRGDFDAMEVKADEVKLGTLKRRMWPLHDRWTLKPA